MERRRDPFVHGHVWRRAALESGRRHGAGHLLKARAAVRQLVPCVSPHVSRDHVPPAGRVRTLRALVRLLAGVSPLVRAQVVGPAENLPADATRVGLDSCVEPHVSRQHVRAGERSLAHVAHVALGRRRGGGVGLLAAAVPAGHVLGKAVMQREHLAADGADVRGGVRAGRDHLHHGTGVARGRRRLHFRGQQQGGGGPGVEGAPARGTSRAALRVVGEVPGEGREGKAGRRRVRTGGGVGFDGEVEGRILRPLVRFQTSALLRYVQGLGLAVPGRHAEHLRGRGVPRGRGRHGRVLHAGLRQPLLQIRVRVAPPAVQQLGQELGVEERREVGGDGREGPAGGRHHLVDERPMVVLEAEVFPAERGRVSGESPAVVAVADLERVVVQVVGECGGVASRGSVAHDSGTGMVQGTEDALGVRRRDVERRRARCGQPVAWGRSEDLGLLGGRAERRRGGREGEGTCGRRRSTFCAERNFLLARVTLFEGRWSPTLGRGAPLLRWVQ